MTNSMGGAGYGCDEDGPESDPEYKSLKGKVMTTTAAGESYDADCLEGKVMTPIVLKGMRTVLWMTR